MIQSIQFRQTSFHLEPEWSERRWDRHGKNNFQKLLDCGFKIGGLQNRMDDAGLQKGELTDGEVRSYLKDLDDYQAEFDTWYRDFLSLSPSPLIWVGNESPQTQPGRPMNLFEPDDDPIFDAFIFSSLHIATAMIFYWGLKIVVASTVRQLWNELRPSQTLDISSSIRLGSSRFRQSHGHEKGTSQDVSTSDGTSDLSRGQSLPFRTDPPIQTLVSESQPSIASLSNDPIVLATNIVRAMPFCLSDDQGLLGAQQSLFPLRTALFILRLYPGTELRRCEKFYVAMNERKGLRYAKEIAKMDGGHGTRGNERAVGVTPAVTPPPRPETQPYAIGQTERSC